MLVLISIIFVLWEVIKIDEIIMKKIYPLKYNEYIEKYAKENDIEKELVYAIIKIESNFNPNAKSKKDAIGLMQIMESTGKEVGKKLELKITEEDLYKPKTNIKIGTKYLADLIEKYEGNYSMAIIAYNAGIGNVDKWIEEGIIKADGTDLENVPFKETNNYVRKVLRDYKIYKKYII